MASQLEKQLRVPEGKYTTSELARLKGAKEDSREAFKKAKKMIDSKKSDKSEATGKNKTTKKSASTKARKASSPAKKSVSNTRPKPRPKSKSPGPKVKSSSPKQSKAPSSGSSPKAGSNLPDRHVSRKAPGKPKINQETKSERGRPAAMKRGGDYTREQWEKMTRQERKAAGLPVSTAGAARYFWLK